jgi:hypothetical protein
MHARVHTCTLTHLGQAREQLIGQRCDVAVLLAHCGKVLTQEAEAGLHELLHLCERYRISGWSGSSGRGVMVDN